MPSFGSIAYTEEVRAAQRRLASPVAGSAETSEPFVLDDDVVAFVESVDTAFLATTSSTGWPYVQHRGGPPGFLRALGPASIGFADLRGNRQYVTLGNLAGDDRVALLLLDPATRTRLKLLGRARVVDDVDDPTVRALAEHADGGRVERAIVIDVVAAAWNCRQHIVQRFTADEVADAIAPLRARIAELESQLAATRPPSDLGRR